MLIKESEIQDKLKYLAYQVSQEFDEVTLLVALSGGVYTAVDFSKYLTIPVRLEFVKISSYGDEQESGIVELKWISAEKGSHLGNLLIVDDICDTGKTIDYLLRYIKNNYTTSALKVLTLLDKPKRREVIVPLDYKGFTIDNLFVYGYGLDDCGYSRNITNICVKED